MTCCNKALAAMGGPVLMISSLAVPVTVLAETVLQAPALVDWNPVNALTVHPDSPDGRTYLYPDTTTRDADTLGNGTGSPGFIIWELDDGSGRAPGIQAVTNDTPFRVNNCVMASGIRSTGLPKTCSDPPSSAKRFKMIVTEAGAAVDLVFDTGNLDIAYEDGIDTATVEVGRVYRVLQKLTNDTGERIQHFRVELGFGTGGDFTPVDAAADGVGFELRTEVDSQFFGELASDADHGGGLPCATCHKADDPSLSTAPQVDDTHGGGRVCSYCHSFGPTRVVWDPDEFSNFSPSMFDPGIDARFDEGFFDDDVAGLFPPQDFELADQTQFIGSGTDVDGATGIVGATTVNYFERFGYLLPKSKLPTGIYVDNDGDPATEGELIAWWDGNDWRYGQDQGFAVVPVSVLADWAERPLSEVEVLEPPRYEAALIDDLGGLNVDTYIYIGSDFDVAANPTLTLRITANAVAPNTVAGSEDPLWTQEGHLPPALESYVGMGDSGSSSGGCSVGGDGRLDPTLPALLAAALGLLGWRRYRARS
jgi:hypothetical protein